MVSEELITDSIKVCRKKGMGVAATYIMDTIMHSPDGKEGYQSINRYEIMKVQTPQAFDFAYIWEKTMRRSGKLPWSMGQQFHVDKSRRKSQFLCGVGSEFEDQPHRGRGNV